MANPVLITPPAIEPVTLAEAKAHLRVDHTADDVLVAGYITAARQQAEAILQRSLLQTEWEAVFPAFADVLPLRMPAVISVSSVKYLDTNGVQQTLPATEWQLITSREPAVLVAAYGKSWPTTRENRECVRVRYFAGYGTTADKVPQPIKQWILLQVGNSYENRGADGVGAIINQPASPFFMGLLDSYRVVEVV